MSTLLTIALSIGVIVALLLAGTGIYMLLKRPRAERPKALLMLAVAAVTIINIWLLTAPVE